jgi:hypothetical protein
LGFSRSPLRHLWPRRPKSSRQSSMQTGSAPTKPVGARAGARPGYGWRGVRVPRCSSFSTAGARNSLPRCWASSLGASWAQTAIAPITVSTPSGGSCAGRIGFAICAGGPKPKGRGKKQRGRWSDWPRKCWWWGRCTAKAA